MPTRIGTAIAAADKPYPELAAEVVHQALDRAGSAVAQGVLLFLSSEYARHPQAAVTAASRAANCLQVAGCTTAGVFTEADWLLDRPAACAMVFCGDACLSGTRPEEGPTLTLATAHEATPDWLASTPLRLGLVSTDAAGQGSGRVWCNAKVLSEGRCEFGVSGARSAIGVSRGIRILSEPAPATGLTGYDLGRVGAQQAASSLLRVLPFEAREVQTLPLHLISLGMLESSDPHALENGDYTLVPVIAVSPDHGSVTLGARLSEGSQVFWTMRQIVAAERDTRLAIDHARADLGADPDFAIVFSCMGRGPYFFGGVDRDLALLKERFPGLSIVGGYGAGEIATLHRVPLLLHNSAAFGLFRCDVQS